MNRMYKNGKYRELKGEVEDMWLAVDKSEIY